MTRRVALVCTLLIVPMLVACSPAGATPSWTPEQVIATFKTAGLEAEGARALTREDYGLAPMLATSGVRFLIPSLCADCGGRVMAFASTADRDKMRDYYVSLGKSSAMFYSHTFVRDNILVQINGELPDDQAKQYEAALAAMK